MRARSWALDRSAAGRGRATAIFAVCALVLFAIVRSAWGTRLDALTLDEPWHIVAGVEYVRRNDYRLNPEHPPLTKLAAGAFMPDSFKLRKKVALFEKHSERAMVEETFFLDNDFRFAQRRARAAMWTLNGAMLFALGILLWRAFGLPWAATTLAFLAVDPTVAAHLPVVMTDLPVAIALSLTALAVGLLLERWQWRWVLAAGCGAGLALGAKHSALPAVAALGAFAASVTAVQRRAPTSLRRAAPRRLGPGAADRGRRGLMLFCVGALALGLLWVQYGLHFHAAPDGRDDFNRMTTDKINDLHVPQWRRLLTFADRWSLLPRSYVWGLADTVRAGIEGRAESSFLLWGRWHAGSPPWCTWPSFIAIKVPLPLLFLAGAGVVALRRAWPRARSRWCVATTAVMMAAHLLTLSSAQGAYAGVRHALPIVVGLAVAAGAVGWQAKQGRSRVHFGIGAIGLGAALAMTAGEPRVWEYHNELAGGSRDAWRFFLNEGIDLGQRAYELEEFNRAIMAPSGLPVYVEYWMSESEAKALGFRHVRRVEELTDANTAGEFDGYFIHRVSERVAQPQFEWQPEEVFRDLVPVARFGAAEVWRGRQRLPKARAIGMASRIQKYVYKEQGSDWELVARRAEEVISAWPRGLGTAIELGNAYLRLGRRDDALRAYRQPLSIADAGFLDPYTRRDLTEQIARLKGGAPLAQVPLVRNPRME